MNGKTHLAVTVLLVVSISCISTMSAAIFLSKHYSQVQFQTLSRFSQVLLEEHAVDGEILMEALKKNRDHADLTDEEHFLQKFGYRADDFTGTSRKFGYLTAILCVSAGIFVFLIAFFCWHNKECKRLQMLIQYLEKVNMGQGGTLFAIGENDYSRLQDEIYKTVSALYQTRDDALTSKKNFADNLYNIAHQLKTPITAISLSAQMIEETHDLKYAKQIQKQVGKLVHLEEALLLLSRIDAGTLTFEKTKIDVFTLLTLAADYLQELSAYSDIRIDIPELGEVEFIGDMEWTMEAIINLLKNCIEHCPAGSWVHCSYEQNPLYVQIRIWDEGRGFEKEDILHLFERFYRGKGAAKGGIGIGLSLSKAIIEMQNGMISAGNLPEGGAYYEIHMYRH